jgi:hypothetical protein
MEETYDISTLSFGKCNYHPNNEVRVICTLPNCDIPIMCPDCAAIHDAHLKNLRKIDDILSRKILYDFELSLASDSSTNVFQNIEQMFFQFSAKIMTMLNKMKEEVIELSQQGLLLNLNYDILRTQYDEKREDLLRNNKQENLKKFVQFYHTLEDKLGRKPVISIITSSLEKLCTTIEKNIIYNKDNWWNETKELISKVDQKTFELKKQILNDLQKVDLFSKIKKAVPADCSTCHQTLTYTNTSLYCPQHLKSNGFFCLKHNQWSNILKNQFCRGEITCEHCSYALPMERKIILLSCGNGHFGLYCHICGHGHCRICKKSTDVRNSKDLAVKVID